MSYLRANMEAAAIIGDCLLAEAEAAERGDCKDEALMLNYLASAFLKASGQMKARIVAQTSGNKADTIDRTGCEVPYCAVFGCQGAIAPHCKMIADSKAGRSK